MLFVAMIICAQTSVSVAPILKVGDQKIYHTETVANYSGKTIKTGGDLQVSIKEKLPEGYLMGYEVVSLQNDTTVQDAVTRILGMASEMLKNSRIELTTDKTGYVTGINNMNEVKENINATIQVMADELFQSFPDAANIMSKEKLTEQLMCNVSDDMILKTLRNITSPLTLNGKTIKTGDEESFVSEHGVKMKRVYTVDTHNQVTAQSSVDMNKDDMKTFLLTQVERYLPGQADMLKDNLDMVLDSGLLKIDLTEKAVYVLNKDGWVKSIVVEKSTNLFGNKTATVSTVVLKN